MRREKRELQWKDEHGQRLRDRSTEATFRAAVETQAWTEVGLQTGQLSEGLQSGLDFRLRPVGTFEGCLAVTGHEQI